MVLLPQSYLESSRGRQVIEAVNRDSSGANREDYFRYFESPHKLSRPGANYQSIFFGGVQFAIGAGGNLPTNYVIKNPVKWTGGPFRPYIAVIYQKR